MSAKNKVKISISSLTELDVASPFICDAARLIRLCFDARTIAHLAHFKTTSLSKHLALNEYYDQLVELVDVYTEAYQGRYGIISDYPEYVSLDPEPIKAITNVRNWIDQNRETCGAYPELQNSIDTVQELNNKTLYKLLNLN